jgi:hypothetical protein
MRLRKLNFTVILPVLCLATSFVYADMPTDLALQKELFQQDLNRIIALDESVSSVQTINLTNVNDLASELENKWKPVNREYNARLMLDLFKPVKQQALTDPNYSNLARGYFLSALEDTNQISVETQIQSAGRIITLQPVRHIAKDDTWPQRRREDTQACLHAWQRLNDAIDPNWNPNDRPTYTISPTAATRLAANTPPEAITDPELRAEYEAAINASKEKQERYNRQITLRKRQEKYRRSMINYITQAYSTMPSEVAELSDLLDNYIEDSDIKAGILAKIEKSIRAGTKQ